MLLLYCLAARAQEAPVDRCDSLLRAADAQFARESYSDALEAYRKAQYASQGPVDTRYRKALRGMGSVYAAMGDDRQAREYMDQAKELDTPEGRESYYRMLGQIAEQAARQAAASSVRKEANKLNTGEAGSPDEIDFSLPQAARDHYRQAIDYYLQALAIRQPLKDDTHVYYLMTIGLCQAALDDRESAAALVDRALGIAEELHGPQSSEYAMALRNAALICIKAGDYLQARDLTRRSMRVLGKRDLRRDTLSYINLLETEATIRYDCGLKASAVRMMKRCNRLRRLYYGEKSETYAKGLLDLSMFYAAMPAGMQAQRFHYAAFDYYFDKIRNNFSVLSESDREKYWDNALDYFQQSIALAHHAHTWTSNIRAKRKGSPAAAYNTVLLSKGILLNSSIEFGNHVIASGDAQLIRDYERLCDMRETLDSLVSDSRAGSDLIREADRIEEQILSRLREAGHDYTQNLSVTWDQVRKALRPHDVAIEFYRTASNEYGALVLKRHWRGPRLVRFRRKGTRDIAQMTVVARKQAPFVAQQTGDEKKETRDYTVSEMLDEHFSAPDSQQKFLFDESITDKMARFMQDKGSRRDSPSAPIPYVHGKEHEKDRSFAQDTSELYYKSLLMNSWPLSRAIWGKLRRYMPRKGRGRVYFSPDGILHQLGAEYLPGRKPWKIKKGRITYLPEQTLSDRYDIYRLSSTRQLVTAGEAAPMRQAGLYGGIDYTAGDNALLLAADSMQQGATYLVDNHFEKKLGITPPEYYAQSRGTDDQHGKQRIDPLPGTVFEVHRIDELLAASEIRTDLFTGAFASEEVFRNAAANENLIHLATHGFFISEKEARNFDFILRNTGRNTGRGINPLYRSGLFLSGSKATWNNSLPNHGLHDGLLTAKEISQLDLRRANLIVLSACKTAAGDLQQDGVFGLQRAFKKAGARTLIMSMWKVDDKATELLMTHFYENYLLRGMHTRDAFHAAQNALRQNERYKSPFYWSAFLLLDPDIQAVHDGKRH